MPGVAVGDPSSLVMVRSATPVTVSRSVAESLAGVGSVTPIGAETDAVFET